MTYLEMKKNTFRSMIGDLYYTGCLGYTEIYIIALLYYKNTIASNEITTEEIKEQVHDEINSLIDLD